MASLRVEEQRRECGWIDREEAQRVLVAALRARTRS
jgi:hypothetical protein